MGLATICVVGGVSLVAPSAAFAAQPHCGQVVKKDVKLKRNLNCSASGTNGLVIGKDGVDIDLNGHKIIGPDGSYYGVDDGGGYDRVTIHGGTIRGFGYGVYAYYASKLTVKNVDVQLKGDNNNYGLYIYYSLSPQIDHVTVDNAYYAFYFYDNVGLRLSNSKATGNDSTKTYGLYDYYSTGKVDNFRASGAYDGAYLGGSTNGYTIKNSTFNNAGYAGVYVSNSTPLYQYDYTLTANTANSAGSYGFYASYDVKGGKNKATGAGTKNFYNVPH